MRWRNYESFLVFFIGNSIFHNFIYNNSNVIKFVALAGIIKVIVGGFSIKLIFFASNMY